MPEDFLRVRYSTLPFPGFDIHVRTLWDTQQYRDDGGVSEALGISPESWPLFGVVWPAGRALAELMVHHDIAGRRILEVGCGIALASLVLNARAADITATDRHPEVGPFLQVNVELNGGPDIPFVRTGWADGADALGLFDLVIGSDVLYEPDHASLLAGFVDRHARPACEVLIVDAGRGQCGRFGREMEARGFATAPLERSNGRRILRYFRELRTRA